MGFLQPGVLASFIYAAIQEVSVKIIHCAHILLSLI